MDLSIAIRSGFGRAFSQELITDFLIADRGIPNEGGSDFARRAIAVLTFCRG
jgi:hypothetical protein